MENTNNIECSFIFTPVVNFAMQQNHVPLIRSAVVNNISEVDFSNIEVVIRLDPEIAPPFTRNIDRLAVGDSLDLGNIELNISAKFLRELTEQITGTITIEVNEKQQNIYSKTYTVEFLAYDQWSGLSIIPEMLSAFVTPNHPLITDIIKRASAILNGWTGNPSFDDYQSKNPNWVKQQMAAIYEAISERQIVYCTTPASFGNSGQRVRLSDAVLTQKMGNCLDLSLLYASCLESIGLYPLIITKKGHAFAGAWLVEDTFSDSVNDDISLLTKRVAEGINEVVLVECTCMNAGQSKTFDDASNVALQHLKAEEDFHLFVDVKRSRFGGIRPLPQIVEPILSANNNEAIIQSRVQAQPQEIDITPIDKLNTQTAVTKQQIWERKLLDLGLRNNLLNTRISKKTIQLISVDIGHLEDALADGDEFQLASVPKDWDNPLRSSGIYKAIHATDPIIELVKQELSQRRIRTYLPEDELQPALKTLYNSARVSLEENGANTLYMALGLLKWYETPKSEKARFAPIILIPVEMIRKSAQKGYVVRGREEEPALNITLLEMLRQDFGIQVNGLNPLPVDDSGVNVKLILNTIRKSIMQMDRWDVEEQAILGTFSFNKFIMWNDIRTNSVQMSENKIISSLLHQKLEWDVADFENPFDLDNKHPSDIVLPILADSSQMEAVCAAVNEQSFVLHGPPGTGKSQTITNIIANALYKGKRVLFVAEKMAALSVVQKRLDDIGLAPFCLELHSNKAQKSTVLAQLKLAIEVSKKSSPEAFMAEAEQISLVRKDLNEYVDRLHITYPFGLSLFDAFAGYAQFSEFKEIASFNHVIHDLTKDKLDRWLEIIEELKTAIQIAKPSISHPLIGIGIETYSALLKDDVVKKLTSTVDAIKNQRIAEIRMNSLFNDSLPISTRSDTFKLFKLAEILLDIHDVPLNLLSSNSIDNDIDLLSDLIIRGKKRDKNKNLIIKIFSESVFEIDAHDTRQKWLIAGNEWFLARWSKQNKIRKIMAAYSINGKVEKNSILAYLEAIIAFKIESELIDKQAPKASSILGKLWKQGNCDWTEVEEMSAVNIQLHDEIASIYNDSTIAKQINQSVSALFSIGKKAFLKADGGLLSICVEKVKETEGLIEKLKKTLEIKETNNDTTVNWLDFWQIKISQLLDNVDELKNWCLWNSVKKKATQLNLNNLIEAIENNKTNSEKLFGDFQKSFYHACAEYILEQDPKLANFNGTFFESKINKFKDLCKNFETLTQKEIFARLASRIPSSAQDASQNSELGILLRNIRNNGRATSLRKLFDSIPNLLIRTSPCMLMSPISVAQYLDIANQKFDLVIFDEASQMPTSEAVGAIARGHNVIVVGDPMQMPPTSFFTSNYIDEDNIEVEDLESILDDCLALPMPSKYLLWHYRSKHESLIAFSNSQFYDNKLLTFPSPDDLATKVSYIHIDGCYDKGKSRQNGKEAEAIVNEVERRLMDPEASKFSIGIVTFSAAQQSLIEDLLNERFIEKPQLETIATERNEPLFIKNLENVQGDERDIILFSIGYGPDVNGKISMNFGPLNRDGGGRRLNVAVSRARYEMLIFSTLRSDQIDPNRTTAKGVLGLKSFLEFAEKGKSFAIPKKILNKLQTFDFEKFVAKKLEENGFTVHTNIGCSGYRIDIGVVDPKNPSKYVLGILCDGKNYRSARTAQDREIVQRNALKLLGWNIHQIWSTDWWANQEVVLNGILEKLNSIDDRIRTTTVTKPIIEPMTSIPLQSLQPIMEDTILVSNPKDEISKPYKVAELEYVRYPNEEICNWHLELLCEQVNTVIQVEAPISKELLCKRVLSAWGISRLGSRINDRFEFDIFPKLNNVRTTSKNGKLFFWNPEQNPSTYDVFRLSDTIEDRRNAEDLSPEEVSNAVSCILKQQISMFHDELSKETARLMGYSRSGGNVEKSMNQGIQKAIDRGIARRDGERIIVVD